MALGSAVSPKDVSAGRDQEQQQQTLVFSELCNAHRMGCGATKNTLMSGFCNALASLDAAQ